MTNSDMQFSCKSKVITIAIFSVFVLAFAIYIIYDLNGGFGWDWYTAATAGLAGIACACIYLACHQAFYTQTGQIFNNARNNLNKNLQQKRQRSKSKAVNVTDGRKSDAVSDNDSEA